MSSKIQSMFAVTEIELVYRNKIKPTDRHRINSSQAAYDILISIWDMNKIQLQEQVNILLLDGGSYCLGFSNIGNGGFSTCYVDPKMIFATALKAKASSIIMAHNHPSGGLQASTPDLYLTEKLCESGRMLELPIKDHLIVTPYGYNSFMDSGLMP